jgi:hypothetical protein
MKLAPLGLALLLLDSKCPKYTNTLAYQYYGSIGGAMTLIITTFGITEISITIKNAILSMMTPGITTLDVAKLSVALIYCYAERRYTDCRYADCRRGKFG